jgi:hypothetical protein
MASIGINPRIRTRLCAAVATVLLQAAFCLLSLPTLL